MKYLLLLPPIVQAITMFVDEFYFHFAPGQPRWERMDTRWIHRRPRSSGRAGEERVATWSQ
jgi:hypothetical protein